MNLVSTLMSGMKGAENGTAEIYRRGTSTRATYYTDFEATGVFTSGADVVLDSNGRAEVYVNELCDVLVKDSLGAVIADFTVGESAPDVEYRGQSFTGVAYDTAASGAGSAYPVSLQAILDLWKTNAKSIDWKVLIGSTATTLYTALNAVSGLFFNVKDPTYGAVGDGSTDDAAAINAAIAAAATNGGIVFFPPGTYVAKSVITLSAKVSILGCGPESSILKIDHSTADLLSATGAATTSFQAIDGIQLAAKQSNTGKLLTVGASTKLLLRNCALGGTNAAGYMIYGVAMTGAAWLSCEDCLISTASTNKTAILLNTGAFTMSRCLCKTPASYTPAAGAYGTVGGFVYATSFAISDCIFDNSAAAAGTYVCVHANNSTATGTVTGCIFGTGAGATVTYIALGTYAGGMVFKESNNTFGTDTAYSYTVTAASAGAQVGLGTRETRVKRLASDAAAPALPTDQYGIVLVTRSTNGNQAFTGAACPEGCHGEVWVYNGSGGDIAVEIPDTLFSPQVTSAPTNGKTVVWCYTGMIYNSSVYLRVKADPYVHT